MVRIVKGVLQASVHNGQEEAQASVHNGKAELQATVHCRQGGVQAEIYTVSWARYRPTPTL